MGDIGDEDLEINRSVINQGLITARDSLNRLVDSYAGGNCDLAEFYQKLDQTIKGLETSRSLLKEWIEGLGKRL